MRPLKTAVSKVNPLDESSRDLLERLIICTNQNKNVVLATHPTNSLDILMSFSRRMQVEYKLFMNFPIHFPTLWVEFS